MRPRVYLETTVIGYLAASPSRDIVTAAHQQVTREWWSGRRADFDLFVSEFVVDEAGAGDAHSAAARLQALEGIPVLKLNEDASNLARDLIQGLGIPDRSRVDAFHIAISVVNGMDYLLTWNCAHIANAVLFPRIARLCQARDYEMPIICTPEQLAGGS